MLFAITYESIIETVSDFYSFGFRKNRNANQALSVLFTRLNGRYSKNQVFYAPRYVLNYDIEKFFDLAEYNGLIQKFPVHDKYKPLLKD